LAIRSDLVIDDEVIRDFRKKCVMREGVYYENVAAGVADADWQGQSLRPAPMQIFQRLGVTAKDGFTTRRALTTRRPPRTGCVKMQRSIASSVTWPRLRSDGKIGAPESQSVSLTSLAPRAHERRR
jgi:hypothetical protein